MRGIASCYNEHAVKVADSYCSGPSNQAFLSPRPTPSVPFAVTSIYRRKLSTQKYLTMALTWSQNLAGKGFIVNLGENESSPSAIFGSTCRRMLGVIGSKAFRFRDSSIQVFWDLSEAQFDPGPEPSSGFYVLFLVDSEVAMYLGDEEERMELEKLKLKNPVPKSSLISRTERFSGNAICSTKAQFSESGEAREILVRCGDGESEGERDRALSVFIDKRRIFQVNRLKWNFRGNQTIFLDGLLVDMMWDVYDWLFNPPSGTAIFMFRTRSGLDSRLWLEEKILEQQEQEKVGFSLLISACRNPD